VVVLVALGLHQVLLVLHAHAGALRPRLWHGAAGGQAGLAGLGAHRHR
jgi:hypothetical protein